MRRTLLILLIPFSVYSMGHNANFESINSLHYEQTWLNLLSSERPVSQNPTHGSQNLMSKPWQTQILQANQEPLVVMQEQPRDSSNEPIIKTILAIMAADVQLNEKGVEKKPFPCPYSGCTREYSSPGYCNMHIRKVHERNSKFSCEKCGLVVGHQRELDNHRAACDKRMPGLKRILNEPQNKPFPCIVPGCMRGYESETARKVHENAKHSDDPKFVCLLCGLSMASNANLRTHEEGCIKRKLTGAKECKASANKRYKCTVEKCQRGLGSEVALRAHIRADHELRYVCSICGHKLAGATTLRIHEEKHKI